ncbi:hypothetical protein ON010_g17973 [Phytophthora cinnamomi]|nr:hypothetical protein ON010_g17973 [Phytophthora cinnamomi]
MSDSSSNKPSPSAFVTSNLGSCSEKIGAGMTPSSPPRERGLRSVVMWPSYGCESKDESPGDSAAIQNAGTSGFGDVQLV